jgi:hypothetical protein
MRPPTIAFQAAYREEDKSRNHKGGRRNMAQGEMGVFFFFNYLLALKGRPTLLGFFLYIHEKLHEDKLAAKKTKELFF